MHRKQKVTCVVIGLLLAALIGGCAWYSRPVDIYTLAPGLEEPYFGLLMLRDTEDAGHYDQRSLDLEPGTADYDAVMEQVEALRFRRSPFNPLIQLLPGTKSKPIKPGDFQWFLTLQSNGGGEFRYLDLRFWIDEWEYVTLHNGPIYHVISQAGGEDPLALSEYLWELSEDAS